MSDSLRWNAFGLVLVLFLAGPVSAETAQQKGYRIAKAASDRDNAYRDQIGSGKMILRDRSGRESVRDFDFKSMETGSGNKAILVFNWPGDIRDTGLLTYSHARRDDDQWLYLPAIRRVKRITSTGRSGAFVGSEFAYEDMVNQQLDKYSYEWIRDEACPPNPALACHVIDRFPKIESGYSKQRTWLDKSKLRLHQTYYFDRGGRHIKTLTVRDHRLYNGRLWRGMNLNVVNLRTAKSTQLKWRGIKFGTGLREHDFTRRALEKLR